MVRYQEKSSEKGLKSPWKRRKNHVFHFFQFFFYFFFSYQNGQSDQAAQARREDRRQDYDALRALKQAKARISSGLTFSDRLEREGTTK